jgi:[histone H3]-lysine79 N-trimethyltransferase
MMDETTSDSDGEVTGPTTRRAWSDWCSSKDKSSQSEEENNNSTPASTRSSAAAAAAGLPARPVNTTKKRKKLTRVKSTNNSSKPQSTATAAQKKQRGRVKKGKRRVLKITGLDLLHSHTLMSTSEQAIGKRLPAAKGCVDQQLTTLAGDMQHEELDIPPVAETPYALQILLDLYK